MYTRQNRKGLQCFRSVLQYAAVRCSCRLRYAYVSVKTGVRCIAVCCSVLQYVVVCRTMLQMPLHYAYVSV